MGFSRSLSLSSICLQDGGACAPGFGLFGGVNLKQPEDALDNLHSGLHRVRFERNVGQAVDFDAGRDFDEQRRFIGERQESRRSCADKGGVLGLKAVEEDKRPQFNIAHCWNLL